MVARGLVGIGGFFEPEPESEPAPAAFWRREPAAWLGPVALPELPELPEILMRCLQMEPELVESLEGSDSRI